MPLGLQRRGTFLRVRDVESLLAKNRPSSSAVLPRSLAMDLFSRSTEKNQRTIFQFAPVVPVVPLSHSRWGMHLLIFLCIHVLKSRTVLQSVFRWILPSLSFANGASLDLRTSNGHEHELFRHVEIETLRTEPQLAKALDFLRQVLIVGFSQAETASLWNWGFDNRLGTR